MAVLRGEDIEKRSIDIVACLMAAAARTAPKTRGLDSMKILLVTGEDIEKLAEAMEDKSREKTPELKFFFKRCRKYKKFIGSFADRGFR